MMAEIHIDKVKSTLKAAIKDSYPALLLINGEYYDILGVDKP